MTRDKQHWLDLLTPGKRRGLIDPDHPASRIKGESCVEHNLFMCYFGLGLRRTYPLAVRLAIEQGIGTDENEIQSRMRLASRKYHWQIRCDMHYDLVMDGIVKDQTAELVKQTRQRVAAQASLRSQLSDGALTLTGIGLSRLNQKLQQEKTATISVADLLRLAKVANELLDQVQVDQEPLVRREEVLVDFSDAVIQVPDAGRQTEPQASP